MYDQTFCWVGKLSVRYGMLMIFGKIMISIYTHTHSVINSKLKHYNKHIVNSDVFVNSRWLSHTLYKSYPLPNLFGINYLIPMMVKSHMAEGG